MPPSPNMPLEVHHCWRRVYDYCTATFCRIRGYREHDARLSADAVVATFYTPSGRGRAPMSSRKLPAMGPLMELGRFIRMWSADADGDIVMVEEEKTVVTPLLWSQSHRSCVLFSGLKFGRPLTPNSREHSMMQMWSKGRPASGAFELTNVPEPMMRPGRAAIAVEYFSDKFTHGEPIFYVHHHEAHVIASESTSKRRNGDPVAILLRGGRLRITRDGLEG